MAMITFIMMMMMIIIIIIVEKKKKKKKKKRELSQCCGIKQYTQTEKLQQIGQI